MNRRLLFASAAPALAVPFQAWQAELLDRMGYITWANLPVLLLANFVLVVGACALAADLPLAGRAGKALLVGIGVPLLIPAPTVLDTSVLAVLRGPDASSWFPYLVPDLLLLLMLGGAEAWLYLRATRPKPQT